MGIYVFSREVLLDMLERGRAIDFGKEIIPAALGPHQRARRSSIAATGRTSARSSAFYDANMKLTRRGAPFNFFHPHRPIYTHPRFLPATRTLRLPASTTSSWPRAASSTPATIDESVVGIRTHVGAGATITRSVLLGADLQPDLDDAGVPLGIGKDVVLDRVIVDKNARIGDAPGW